MALFLLGIAAGILSGMGVGGGSLLVPALIYFWHTPQLTAQGVIMVIFLPTALCALYMHYRNHYLNLRLTGILILGAFPGAIFGSVFAHHLSGDLLARIFGGFLIFCGLQQIFTKNRKKESPGGDS